MSHSDGQALMVVFYGGNRAMLMSPAESLRFTEGYNRTGTEYYEQMEHWLEANHLPANTPCDVDSRYALEEDCSVEMERQIRPN